MTGWVLHLYREHRLLHQLREIKQNSTSDRYWATELCFPVVLFIMLYKVVLMFESVDETLMCDHSNESYWAKLTCGTVNMLYKVVLTFKSVDEILKCDHSNESYWAVLFCGTVYYAVRGGSNVWVCGWNPMMWPFKWKLVSSTFLWSSLFCVRSFWL